MFSIYGGATEFKQWELDKLVTNPCMKEGDEVVFHGYGKVYEATAFLKDGEVVADVPNFLLQKSGSIRVDLGWGLDCHLDCRATFTVVAQEKPDDYVCKYNLPDRSAKSGGSGDTSAPSDWNAAEGEPGHVLNRTHWVEEGETNVLFEQDVTFDDGTMAEQVGHTIDPAPFALEAGKEYIVTWNGTDYKFTAQERGQYVWLGSMWLYDNAWPDSDDDIVVAYDTGYDSIRTHIAARTTIHAMGETISVSVKTIETTVHPLPPELGGMPTLASDGSDAGKTVKANAKGDGYELVKDAGGGSIPVVAKDNLTREQMIQFAKENTEHIVLVTFENGTSNSYATIDKVNSYYIHYADGPDPCDPCSYVTARFLDAYASVQDSPVWSCDITVDEYNEIQAAWKALAGVTE